MIRILFLLGFGFGGLALAIDAVELGRFSGLAFSSATLRHPLEISGGNLLNCEAPRSDLTVCDVQKGVLVVSGTEITRLSAELNRVVILRSEGEFAGRHYYYRGNTNLQYGSKTIPTKVTATLTIYDKTPDLLRGFLELPDVHARTSLEAYRAN